MINRPIKQRLTRKRNKTRESYFFSILTSVTSKFRCDSIVYRIIHVIRSLWILVVRDLNYRNADKLVFNRITLFRAAYKNALKITYYLSIYITETQYSFISKQFLNYKNCKTIKSSVQYYYSIFPSNLMNLEKKNLS